MKSFKLAGSEEVLEKEDLKSAFKKRPVLVAVLIGLIVITFSYMFWPDGSSRPITTPAQSSVSVGEEGYLRSGSEDVLIATSKANLESITRAAVANDNYGMTQLVAQGGGFFVPNGTKGLVIDSSVGA